MAKSKVNHDAVYSKYLQERVPRDLGTVRDGESLSTPSNTVRPLESVIPRNQMRMHDKWDWNPRTGKSKVTKYADDVVHHAQHSINSNKIPSVTDGFRQRRNERVSVETGQGFSRMGMTPPSPVPLSGKKSQAKRRY